MKLKNYDLILELLNNDKTKFVLFYTCLGKYLWQISTIDCDYFDKSIEFKGFHKLWSFSCGHHKLTFAEGKQFYLLHWQKKSNKICSETEFLNKIYVSSHTICLYINKGNLKKNLPQTWNNCVYSRV